MTLSGDGSRTLGVVGTLIWDRIFDRDSRSEPVEEWGGIAYALSALSAALPDDWRILPIVKVGRDLAEEGRRFLLEIPRVDDRGIVVVPEPNNRVELRYEDTARRTERMRGGVPPWTWPELSPFTELSDALYVNFISGFETRDGPRPPGTTARPGRISTHSFSASHGRARAFRAASKPGWRGCVVSTPCR